MQFFFLITYYLKCAFNILYSYFFKNSQIYVNTVEFKKNKLNDYLYTIKLKGTYYEMGQQYGEELKDIIIKDKNIWYNFIIKNENIFLKKIPKKFRKKTIIESLQCYCNTIEPYLNSDILELIRGVSENTQIDYTELLLLNLFTDITDNHCILVSKKINNKTLDIRTLDFGAALMSQILVIFFPKNKNSYLSLQGSSCVFSCCTGTSSKGIFFGESYYDSPIGEQSVIGMPFHHLSHTLLSNANNFNDIESILKNIKRKSNLHLLISNNSESRIYLSCSDTLKIHDILKYKNLIYSVSPNERLRFNKNKKYLNCIDNVFSKFIPNTKSGEVHIMIMYDNMLYISVTTSLYQSYNNTFYKFSLKDLFRDT